jgi:hypothetical protein
LQPLSDPLSDTASRGLWCWPGVRVILLRYRSVRLVGPAGGAAPGAYRSLPRQLQRGVQSGRAQCGLGSRVLISQFLKGRREQGPSERSVQLCGRLQWLRPVFGLWRSRTWIRLSRSCASEFGRTPVSSSLAVIWISWCSMSLAWRSALGYLDELEVVSALEQRPGSTWM